VSHEYPKPKTQNPKLAVTEIIFTTAILACLTVGLFLIVTSWDNYQ
jgi:hypothetical protein